MSTYETEEDQVKALKQWWQENGRAVIFGLVVGVGGIVGWQYWQSQQVAKQVEASGLYNQLVESMEQEARSKAIDAAQALQAQYPDTPYADLAALQLAQAQLGNGNREGAIEVLQSLAQTAHNEAIKQLANLRAYRLQLAGGQAQAVVDALTSIEADQFYGQFHELRGDALVSLGQLDQARSAYLSAMDSVTTDKRMLRLKLEDLGVAAQSEQLQ